MRDVFGESMRGVAPALIVCGEYDPLRDDAFHYANRLRDASVDATLRCYAGESHMMSPAGKEKELAESHETLRSYIGSRRS